MHNFFHRNISKKIGLCPYKNHWIPEVLKDFAIFCIPGSVVWCEVPRGARCLWTLDGVSMVRGWSVTCYSDADRDPLRSGTQLTQLGVYQCPSLGLSRVTRLYTLTGEVLFKKKNRIFEDKVNFSLNSPDTVTLGKTHHKFKSQFSSYQVGVLRQASLGSEPFCCENTNLSQRLVVDWKSKSQTEY